MERAMNSEHEAEAMRLADECARTLLAYRRAENAPATWVEGYPLIRALSYHAWKSSCQARWRDHEDALDRFERTFPQVVDWREMVPQAVLRQLAEARP